jgi:cell wall-associated NlpC family hydrolase
MKMFRSLLFITTIFLINTCSSSNKATVTLIHMLSSTQTSILKRTPIRTSTLPPIPSFTSTPPISIKAAELAKEIATLSESSGGGNYLSGGQGWDWKSNRYVEPSNIIEGYYYKPFIEDSLGTRVDKFVIGKGLDCSGLIQWANNKAYGATERFNGPINREGPDNIYHQDNLIKISESDLKPGDLLFFDREEPFGKMEHMVMYVGGSDESRNVVESANPEDGIIFTSKNNLKLQYGAKWINYRRLIQ